jgi:dihydroorotate dehydrogenase electron transfer subunit
MRDELCRVIENTRIQEDYFLLKIHSEYVSSRAVPGNFIMLSSSPSSETLLKRPFGIFQAIPPHLWIYYQVVGKGTRLISNLKTGDTLSMLGPLGNSFPAVSASDPAILMIAGGRGIAPLHFTISKYRKKNKIILIYGARSKPDLNHLDSLKSMKLDTLRLYTEDGSIGKRGTVISDLTGIIQEHGIRTIFSCGPDDMLVQISKIIKGLKARHYASLEALMGCGFGICGSCVIQTIDNEYKKVCTDGPVFDMDEIKWQI